MMQIIFLLLKIIGIVLTVLLGLFLLITLAVLFIPGKDQLVFVSVLGILWL